MPSDLLDNSGKNTGKSSGSRLLCFSRKKTGFNHLSINHYNEKYALSTVRTSKIRYTNLILPRAVVRESYKTRGIPQVYRRHSWHTHWASYALVQFEERKTWIYETFNNFFSNFHLLLCSINWTICSRNQQAVQTKVM